MVNSVSHTPPPQHTAPVHTSTQPKPQPAHTENKGGGPVTATRGTKVNKTA